MSYSLSQKYIYDQKMAKFGVTSLSPEDNEALKRRYAKVARMDRGRLRSDPEYNVEGHPEYYAEQVASILPLERLRQVRKDYDQQYQQNPKGMSKDDQILYDAVSKEDNRRLKMIQEFQDATEEKQAELLLQQQETYAKEPVDNLAEEVKLEQDMCNAEAIVAAHRYVMQQEQADLKLKQALQKREEEQQEELQKEQETQRQAQEQQSQEEQEDEQEWERYEDNLMTQIVAVGETRSVEEMAGYLARGEVAMNMSVKDRNEKIQALKEKANDARSYDEEPIHGLAKKYEEEALLYEYANAHDRVGRVPKQYRNQVQKQDRGMIHSSHGNDRTLSSSAQTQGSDDQQNQQNPPKENQAPRLAFAAAPRVKEPTKPHLINPQMMGEANARLAAENGKGFIGQEAARIAGQALALHEDIQILKQMYRDETPPHELFINRVYNKVHDSVQEWRDKRNERSLARGQMYLAMWNPTGETIFTQKDLERIARYDRPRQVKRAEQREDRLHDRHYRLSGQARIDRKNGVTELEREFSEHPEKFPTMNPNSAPLEVDSVPLKEKAVRNLAKDDISTFQDKLKYMPTEQFEYLAEATFHHLDPDDPRQALAQDVNKAGLLRSEFNSRAAQVESLASTYDAKDLTEKVADARHRMMEDDQTTVNGQRRFSRHQLQAELLEQAKSTSEIKTMPIEQLVATYSEKSLEADRLRLKGQPWSAKAKEREIRPIGLQIQLMGKSPDAEVKAYREQQYHQQQNLAQESSRTKMAQR